MMKIMLGLMVYMLIGSGALTLASPTDGPLDKAGIQWSTCNDSSLQALNAECALLSVPLDHDQPQGTQIKIAISRLRHNTSAGRYQGVMVISPGGPGVYGLRTVSRSRRLPADVAGSYDWIGFDPRGHGSSQPALSCIPDYLDGPRRNYVPKTPALEQYWLNRSRNYAEACAQKYPTLLEHMTSLDVVKDMELIRIALGAPKINFYGFGFATYYGQLYVTLFPNRVQRMVLDSSVNSKGVWFPIQLSQDIALDRNLKKWFEWLAQYDEVYHLGTSAYEVERRFRKAMKELADNPADGVIGSDEWLDIFLNAATSPRTWLDLASVFAAWTNEKNATGFMDWYVSGDDNAYAGYLTEICGDAPWPRDWDRVKLIYWRTYISAPFYTWQNAWYNGPCQYWPVHGRKLVKVDGSLAGKLLLVGETLNSIVPFKNTRAVRRQFPNAVLVGVVKGLDFRSSLIGNPCVDDVVAEYLRTGKLPARKAGDTIDVRCAPLPAPNPLATNDGTI